MRTLRHDGKQNLVGTTLPRTPRSCASCMFRAIPLLLANVWDPTSARVVESAGMRAIATASTALAPVNGYEDHGHLPPDVAFSALRRIADAVTLPVTADLEDGYGLSPEEFVDRLADAGACGANLEDTDHRVGALLLTPTGTRNVLPQSRQLRVPVASTLSSTLGSTCTFTKARSRKA